jgi:hypothetical protein
MSYQFGIGVMYGGPSGSEVEFGCVQGVTLDFSFDRAELHCGNDLYPQDVRVHTASISGRSQFADIDAEALYKVLGGDSYTPGDTDLTIKADTSPASFRIRFLTTTDGVNLQFTLNQCRTDSLSWNFGRTDYVVPDFSFTAFADSDGNVGTLELGDPS